MNKLKQILKNLSFYMPLILLVLMAYLSWDLAVDGKLAALMSGLVFCFLWIGDYLRQNNNESATLRQEIEELKKMKNL
jgi:hypothetical protein